LLPFILFCFVAGTNSRFFLNFQSAPKTNEEGADEDLAAANQPFLQHQEWVKFQQSITVDGFETGQTVTASTLKKSRGGKQARKRREKELERLQQSSQTSSSDLKFPAIRYSEEETQELLKLAFAARPERAGKRGSRNLKRQARRWHLVRQIREKYKRNIIAAHERRMEKRHWKREQVKHMKDAVAPEAKGKDLEYQQQVLTRWSQTMFGAAELADSTEELESLEGSVSGSKTITAKD
jgi:hypothetical protein